jgi:hypothetical protein
MNKLYQYLALILCVCVLSGCGSKYVQFGGKVVFDDDGTPLTEGVVIFTTETFQAEGRLTENGTYQLGSLTPKDGLPPGTYKVFISGAAEYLDNGTVIPFIHPDYLERTTTPLTCEVSRSGLKSFDIRVPRPPQTQGSGRQ